MKDLVSHKISFHMDKQENDELIAYFEQNSKRCSRLEIFELEQWEYFVADSPISDTISGHVDLYLFHRETIQSKCPYEITLHTNLVRNQASSDIYQYVDQLLSLLDQAITTAKPIQIEISNELNGKGWHMACR